MKAVLLGATLALLLGAGAATGVVILQERSLAPVVPDSSAVADSVPAVPAAHIAPRATPELPPVAADTAPDTAAVRALAGVWAADSASRRATGAAPISAGEPALQPQRLARILGAMEPERAAGVLSRMNDGEIRRVLAAMRDRQAAAILASLPPERAAQITQPVLHQAEGGR